MEQQEHNSPFLLPIAIILAGALVGGGIYLAKKNPDATLGLGQVKGNIDEVIVNPVTEDDHILGNPNAPVVIVEFSDTECPFCKSYHNTIHRIIDEYGKDGKVAWVYRHFPIDSLHSKARKESEATECAAELGGNTKFWEYLDEVYARTPSNDGLDPQELYVIAEDIGLNADKFDSCLSSGRYALKVQSHYEDAVKTGGGGTPHTVLITRSGEKITIKGAQPYDVVKTVVDAALSNQGVDVQTP